MTGTDYMYFTHKSVPVIFEPPCIYIHKLYIHTHKIKSPNIAHTHVVLNLFCA